MWTYFVQTNKSKHGFDCTHVDVNFGSRMNSHFEGFLEWYNQLFIELTAKRSLNSLTARGPFAVSVVFDNNLVIMKRHSKVRRVSSMEEAPSSAQEKQ